jgi:hypothetical protein
VSGRANGKGTATYKKNGAPLGVFDGEMKDGKQNGQGVFVSSNGERYEGAWKDGKGNGQGVYVYSNGERYEGAWKDGKRNGLGRQTSIDGGVFHEGQWADDQPVRNTPINTQEKQAKPEYKYSFGDQVQYFGYSNNSGWKGVVTNRGDDRYQVKITDVVVNGFLGTGLKSSTCSGNEWLEYNSDGKLIWIPKGCVE